ncbi:hypothetical protein ARMGADRAFT_1070726 [Armillaria gallica]|uniref:Uncharacterized protein n=1 Tax=Armillaria gallica TaxID=47427 RepID=A0A2H3E9Y8_ARMGA|nr:hypothetical protein ARMGADRAFT_1070726 [Armillaria gallica]
MGSFVAFTPDNYRHAESLASAQSLTYVWTRILGRRNPIVARCMNPPRPYVYAHPIHAFQNSQTLRHSPSLSLSLSSRPFRTYYQEQEIAWSPDCS